MTGSLLRRRELPPQPWYSFEAFECVYGVPLSPLYARLPPGRELAFTLFEFDRRWQRWRNYRTFYVQFDELIFASGGSSN